MPKRVVETNFFNLPHGAARHNRVVCFRAEKDYHDLHWLGEILNNNSSVAPFIDSWTSKEL